MKFLVYEIGPDTITLGVPFKRGVPQKVTNEVADTALGTDAVLDGEGKEIEPANHAFRDEFGFRESSAEELEQIKKAEAEAGEKT